MRNTFIRITGESYFNSLSNAQKSYLLHISRFVQEAYAQVSFRQARTTIASGHYTISEEGKRSLAGKKTLLRRVSNSLMSAVWNSNLQVGSVSSSVSSSVNQVLPVKIMMQLIMIVKKKTKKSIIGFSTDPTGMFTMGGTVIV